MLQYHTVYPSTLDTLKQIMLMPPLAAYNLVGGTALALQLGHRISIDLDLFVSDGTFDKIDIENCLLELGEVRQTFSNPVLYQAYLGDLKLDFVKYRYQPIRLVQVIDGIRMLHLEDIAAMKLSAVTNRGAKKDFFDIFFLLEHYDLATMLSFFSEKYPQQELFFVLKSLTYFEDADSDIDPDMLIATEWETVKTRIAAEVNSYLKGL
jgi:hypothetical protein